MYRFMALQHVWVDESVGAEHWSEWRRKSLASMQIHPPFHYQSVQQTELWLDVFRNHSPAARTGELSASSIYEEMAKVVAERYRGGAVHVISLGCGDGRKDLLLVRALLNAGVKIRWSPQDISLSLVLLTARGADGWPLQGLHPVVSDLQSMPDIAKTFDAFDPETPRLITFFGLLPNFEPDFVVATLKTLIRAKDRLLISANLSPVRDETKSAYLAATEVIKPQYDNPETKRWLCAVVKDWGLDPYLENYRLRIESRFDLLRFVAAMDWTESRELAWQGEQLSITQGTNLRLFFSYRYTPLRFRKLMEQAAMRIDGEWIATSREEGTWEISAS